MKTEASSAANPFRPHDGFRHEALFYEGRDGFVTSTSAFIRGAIEAGDPVFVVVGENKIEWLRSELGDDAKYVTFADMAEVGANPARIMPAWHDFVGNCPSGRMLRGIGEPIYPGRDVDELVECQRYESLLNLAFAEASAFWLLCPYDTTALGVSVIEEALRSHPYALENGEHRDSSTYAGLSQIAQPFDRPLPEPSAAAESFAFDSRVHLDSIRRWTARRGIAAGVHPGRIGDLVLSINELATNTLRYGGGAGILRAWSTATSFICEVQDDGRIEQPLIGRQRPAPSQRGGFGMWLVHQVCDLVQVRTFDNGSVVRMHMQTDRPG